MRSQLFRAPEDFRSARCQAYTLLPFRFMRWNPDELLIVNEVGEYTFLENATFHQFVDGLLSNSAPAYSDLKSQHFLSDSDSTVPVELLALKYRTKKHFLNGFTRLHMFVVTLRCDHTCAYCQVSRVTEDKERFDMSSQTATRAVGLMFQSPAPEIKVEFQGGEPMLNFEMVRHIVNLCEARKEAADKQIEYVVTTNLSRLSDTQLDFLRAHNICVSTSLDGPEALHDLHRRRRGGESYRTTIANLRRVREALGHDRVAALMTTTEASLKYPKEIVDEYIGQGFDSIFLRSISPYGFATRSGLAAAYDSQRFLDFYKVALARILEVNCDGTDFVEVFAQILLRKMLTPFATGYVDLQSPAGAGISAVTYNYDGSVYASDESRMLAEMNDTSFRLGFVTDTYDELFGGETLRRIVDTSCAEALPGCSQCAFVPYCGADPVYHWATQGDLVGHRPTSGFCSKNMGIIRHLFDLLRGGDEFTRNLFLRWATM